MASGVRESAGSLSPRTSCNQATLRFVMCDMGGSVASFGGMMGGSMQAFMLLWMSLAVAVAALLIVALVLAIRHLLQPPSFAYPAPPPPASPRSTND